MTRRTLSMIVLIWLAATPGAVTGSQEEAQSDRLAAEDSLRIRNVGGVRISPDGEWVLYTVGVRDMDDDDLERRTHLWRVRIDGTGGRQLTHGETSAGSPRWFPAGDKIAFTRSADGDSQVFAMYTDGGEAWQLTEHGERVGSYAISPDGARVWFAARDPESDEEKRRKRQRDDAVVVDEEFTWTHLWMLDIDSGETTRLTEGDFTVSDPRWSPDASRIAYVTRPTTKVDDGWNSDIHVLDVATGEGCAPNVVEIG